MDRVIDSDVCQREWDGRDEVGEVENIDREKYRPDRVEQIVSRFCIPLRHGSKKCFGEKVDEKKAHCSTEDKCQHPYVVEDDRDEEDGE